MDKLLVVMFVGLLPLVGLAEWNSKEETELNCISAAKYGIEEKCYACKGCGYVKSWK